MADDGLQAEIIEAQRQRADLIKWKVVLIAALGTVGLGLSATVVTSPWVLICVPFVCAYVDLMCMNLWLRIHVIGEFRRSCDHDDELHEYERFVGEVRQAYSFEPIALFASSFVADAAVAVNGFLEWPATVRGGMTLSAGVGGFLLTLLILSVWRRRRNEVLDAGARRRQALQAARTPPQGTTTVVVGPPAVEGSIPPTRVGSS
jgi:hypothetical protein